MPRPVAGPPSPCIDVCRIDERTGLCAGCWRTLDEIAGWAGFTSAEKQAVLARIEQRKTPHSKPVIHRALQRRSK